jgi:hypothetical protein
MITLCQTMAEIASQIGKLCWQMIPTMEERKLLTGSADTDYFKF